VEADAPDIPALDRRLGLMVRVVVEQGTSMPGILLEATAPPVWWS